jgi:hypothetical protein
LLSQVFILGTTATNCCASLQVTTGDLFVTVIVCIHVVIKLVFAPIVTKKSLIPTAQKELFLHSISFTSLSIPFRYVLAIAKPSLHYTHVQNILFHSGTALFLSQSHNYSAKPCLQHSIGGLSAFLPIHQLFHSQAARALDYLPETRF